MNLCMCGEIFELNIEEKNAQNITLMKGKHTWKKMEAKEASFRSNGQDFQTQRRKVQR